MVGNNTHLTGFRHNHYDLVNEESAFWDAANDRG